MGVYGSVYGSSGSGGSLAAPSLVLLDNEDGTVTATITDSNASATNTLYYLPVSLAWAANPTWLLAGTRTGDGAVVVSMDRGAYLFYVHSELSGDENSSQPAALYVTAEGGAILSQLLEGVKERVLAAGLAGIEAENVHTATVPDGQFFMELPDPSIVVCAAGTQQFVDNGSVPMGFWRTGWTIMVILARPSNRDQGETLRNQWFTWREQIEQAVIYQRWALSGATMLPPIPPSNSILFDRGWWKANALGAPIQMFYRVDRQIGATP